MDAPSSGSGGSLLVCSRNLTGALLRLRFGDVEWLHEPVVYTATFFFCVDVLAGFCSRTDMAYLGHFNNLSRLDVVGGAIFKRGLV